MIGVTEREALEVLAAWDAWCMAHPSKYWTEAEANENALIHGVLTIKAIAFLRERAALSAAPSGWRPIESAPRDGGRVLLLDAQGVSIGAWERGKWRDPQAGWSLLPTHWMPMPSRIGGA